MQLMLLGLPRSGSTWLYKCIARNVGFDKSAREFFNPFINQKHADRLSVCLGSDTLSRQLGPKSHPKDHLESLRGNIRVFAKCTPEQHLEHLYVNTWAKSGLCFTKEVWLLSQIPYFRKKFTILGISRPTELTFPGSYPDLNAYIYLRIYESLIHNFAGMDKWVRESLVFMLEHCRSEKDKVVCCHYLVSCLFRLECLANNITIIEYTDLLRLSLEDLSNEIAKAGINKGLAERICATVIDSRMGLEQLERRYNDFGAFSDQILYSEFQGMIGEHL